MSSMKDLLGDQLYDSGFGTPAHQLHRSDSPSTSVEAAYAVDTTKLEQMVFEAIKGFTSGCIADDLLKRFSPPYPYSSITARFSALERKKFITCGPDKRVGRSGRQQRVMRIRETM